MLHNFLYIFNDLYPFSVIIIVFACVTDFLDDYVARKMNSASDIGAYLDVTADFILIVTCFLAFRRKVGIIYGSFYLSSSCSFFIL
ncbi:MAG: hypothetical protein FJ150_06025 [Euryarchaeota archaeon]|nr:hypothetical protein [Euryarchaeota archaeon]